MTLGHSEASKRNIKNNSDIQMSRIGTLPIEILDGVKVNVEERVISVEGPLGKLRYDASAGS